MDSINVFINYGGAWNDLHEYTGKGVVGLIVPLGVTFTVLKRKIVDRIKLNCTITEVRMQYRVDRSMTPMEILDNEGVAFYLDLKRKDPNLTSFPLCIDLVPIIGNDDVDVICDEHEFILSNKRNAISVITLSLQLQVHGSITPMQITTLEKPSLDDVSSVLCDMAESVTHKTLQKDVNVITSTKISNIDRGQVFLDKTELMKAMKLYAINNRFQFKVKRFDKTEYVLECLDPVCVWTFRASKVGKTNMFKIRKIPAEHTCGVDAMLGDHRQATSAIVVEVIKNKFTSSKADYKPTDIMHDTLVNHGITLSYEKAWREKEHAFNEIMGDPVGSYANLPAYLRVLYDKNPGTITRIETNANNEFKYVFIAMGTSVAGWPKCKPVIVVDGTYLKGQYGSTLFTACTQDANNAIFLLAFDVGDSENNKSWEWFFRMLREAYGERDDLCIVSDWCRSIKNAIAIVYPNAFHGLCCFHVLGNVTKKYGDANHVAIVATQPTKY